MATTAGTAHVRASFGSRRHRARASHAGPKLNSTARPVAHHSDPSTSARNPKISAGVCG